MQETLETGSYRQAISKLIHYAKRCYRHQCLGESGQRTAKGNSMLNHAAQELNSESTLYCVVA